MDTQVRDVLRKMLAEDFSSFESIRTRSGTTYRILSPQDIPPVGVVAPRPASVLGLEQGQITLRGQCYGRAHEKKKPDGTPALPDGCLVTTTPISSIVLRNAWRDALSESLGKGAFSSVMALRTTSGKLYPFSTQETAQATPSSGSRRFVPGAFLNYEGDFLFSGRLYGDDRLEDGAEIWIKGIASVILADKREIDVRKTTLSLEGVETAIVELAP